MGLLDAVGYVGDSLDKVGARQVRGLLGGKPREALSFVPFSDRVGITDPSQIVTGRHLTDQAGLTDKRDRGWGSWGAGVAAEMLLDPTNLVGAGLAKKSLQGAKVLSHSDDLARISSHGLAHAAPGLDMAVSGKKLAGEVAGQPWYLKQFASDLTPASLDPSKLPSILHNDHPGAVKGVGLYGNRDHLQDAWSANQTEQIRDFLTAPLVDPSQGLPPSSYNPNSHQIRASWERNFPGAHEKLGSSPYIYRAKVEPGRVLDVRSTNFRNTVSDNRIADEAAEKIWQARQHMARAMGLDWPDIYPGLEFPDHEAKRIARFHSAIDSLGSDGLKHGEEQLARIIDPKGRTLRGNHPVVPGDWSKTVSPYKLELMAGESHRLASPGYPVAFPPNFWSWDDPDVHALKTLGANNSLLREHLLGHKIDAFVGDGLQLHDEVLPGLNVINHNAITELENLGPLKPVDNEFDWRPNEVLPEDFYALSAHPASPRRGMAVQPWGGGAEQAAADAASLRGPNYPGGMNKLAEIVANAPPHLKPAAEQMLRSGLAERIAGEIPPGSAFFGGGAEAAVLRGGPGHGGVIRLSRDQGPLNFSGGHGVLGRPDVPEVLQPVRSVGVGPYRVEHLPTVKPIFGGRDEALRFNPLIDRLRREIKNPPPGAGPHEIARMAKAVNLAESAMFGGVKPAAERISSSMADALRQPGRGLNPWDVSVTNPSNVSLTREGNSVIHDAGAVWPSDPSNPILPPPQAADLSPEMARWVDELGGPEEVQRVIRLGLDRGTAGQGLPLSTPYAAAQIHNARGSLDEFYRTFGAPQTRGISTTTPHVPLPRMADHSRGEQFGLAELLKGLNSDLSARPGATANVAAGQDMTKHAHGGMDIYRNVPLTKSYENMRPQGGYSSSRNALAVYAGAEDPSKTFRHEYGHGRVDQAVKAGPSAIASLPLAWQPAAWARYAGATGLSRYIDEIAQHSTENKGLLNQLQGGYNFATSRPMIEGVYAPRIARDNPLLRTLMMAGPAAHENRGAIAMGALGLGDLSKLAAQLQREGVE